MTRLSSTTREELYDAEVAKAKAAGRGDLPICNLCDGPIGKGQRWHVSHDPLIPRWMDGQVTGIAHARCNMLHNNRHDTPLYHKVKRNRQKDIGAYRSSMPMRGGRDSDEKKKLNGLVVDRRTNEPRSFR
jgi:hypothetical protein